MTSDEKRDADKKTAGLGLEANLTAGIALEQIADLGGDIGDRLLALKRDVLATERRDSTGRQTAE